MIDKNAARQLVEMAKAVQKFAKAGDKVKETLASKQAHEHAWILLDSLVEFATGIKDADMHYALVDAPGRTQKQQVKSSLAATACEKGAWAVARDFEKKLAKFELSADGVKANAKPYAVFPEKKIAAKKAIAKKVAAKKTPIKKKAV